MIILNLRDGSEAKIIVRLKTRERLQTTCFRGLGLNKAGNFSEWLSVEDAFSDPIFKIAFTQEIEECWENRELGGNSVTIDLSFDVGWESTGEITESSLEFLESFQPNHKSIAMRVKKDRTDILAPRTNDVTVVFELKDEQGHPTAVIHSMYPGVDIGPLNGDITSTEKRFFYDWDHPGEP